MRKLIEGVKTVFIIILTLLVLFNLYALYQRQVKQNSFPMVFGTGYAIVASGSMEPALSWGDLVVVHAQSSYQKGDTITFWTEDAKRPTTHRIKSIEKDQIITKGDANNTEDAAITKKQIYGKVLFAIPFVGYIMQWIMSPMGLLCVIVIFLIMYYFDTRKRK